MQFATTANYGIANAFNNEATQYVTHVNFATNNKNVVLYLFSRRFIPDQWRRPHVYKFGGEFRMALQDNLAKAAQPRPYNAIDKLMLDEPSSRSSILPSAQGQHMGLKSFGDMWTFLLIIDNDNRSPIGNGSIPSRLLYSGWVIDEPVTKGNMGGGWVPNESAVFVTSHHTTLNAHQHLLPSGMLSKVVTTGDYDYLNGTTAQRVQCDGSQLFGLLPHQLANSIIPDPMSRNAFELAASPVEAANKSIEIPAEINNPTYHLGKIVGSMADTVKMMRNDMGGNDVFSGSDAILSTACSFMTPGANIIQNDLNPDSPFTFGELLQRYDPGLKVEVCTQPVDLQYELVSADKASPRNVFTAVLSSSLPSLLAQFGLAEVAFRYNSYQPEVGGLGSTNGARGIFQLFNAATLYTGTDDEIASAWDQLQMYLKVTLFPVIQTNVGHFDVMVHCSLAGVSLINLQILDQIGEPGLVESNNLLGGLNTPLLGTNQELHHNASQMFQTFLDMGTVGTPTQGLAPMLSPVPQTLF